MDPDRQTIDVLYAKQVIRTTERVMRCAAVAVHADLKRGLNTLATITCIAPFVGIFGTICGISFDTFRGLGTEKSTALAAVADGLSRACLPAALGLLVGLQSLWFYRYFRGKLRAFDHDIENASLRLVNQLTLQVGRLRPRRPIEPINSPLPYLETFAAMAADDRRCWRRSALAVLALVLVTAALCLFWCTAALLFPVLRYW